MKKFLSFIIIMNLFVSSASANGLNILTKKYLNNLHSQKIMLVMYHRLSEVFEEQNTYCISPKDFEEDIYYLKNNNYIFAFPDEISVVSRKYPDKNIAVLTFDDGYESDYKYALDILQRYDAKATFFIIGSMIGEKYYMNELQIKELSQNKCAKIGNHSYSIHQKNLEEIISLFSEEKNMINIVNDFEKNKKILESITGKKTDILSYPNSVYNFYMDTALKNSKVCNISLSTEEKSFNYDVVWGRFNRSDKRTVKDIEELLNKKN